MLGTVTQPRGVLVVGALNIRSGIAHISHLLRVKVTRDRDSSPSSSFRTDVGRRPTPTSRAWHLSRFRPDLPITVLETIEAESA